MLPFRDTLLAPPKRGRATGRIIQDRRELMPYRPSTAWNNELRRVSPLPVFAPRSALIIIPKDTLKEPAVMMMVVSRSCAIANIIASMLAFVQTFTVGP